jgi:hypothetical protein
VGLVLLTLILAWFAGRVLGGRLSRLGRLPYRSLPLIGGAAVAYLAGWSAPAAGLPPRWTYAPGLAVAGLLGLALCLLGRGPHGPELIGGGLLADAVVVFANGGCRCRRRRPRCAGWAR